MDYIITIRDFLYNIAHSILSIIRIIILSRPVSIPVLKDDKALVILGNGPSLKETLKKNTGFLKNKTLLAVNHMAETEVYEKLKPALYVTAAPEYWLPDVEEDFLKWRESIFNHIADKTSWKLDFFIPVAARRNPWWKKVLEKNPNIRIHYYNNTPIEGFQRFVHRCFDWKCGMPRPHNVLIPSLMTGIWTGYKVIYLAGADHDWMKDVHIGEDNTPYLLMKHFYDGDKVKPVYMKKLGKGKRKLHEVLETFYLTFKGYHIIQSWAQKKGVKIYNITPGSWIDAFDRKKI